MKSVSLPEFSQPPLTRLVVRPPDITSVQHQLHINPMGTVLFKDVQGQGSIDRRLSLFHYLADIRSQRDCRSITLTMHEHIQFECMH